MDRGPAYNILGLDALSQTEQRCKPVVNKAKGVMGFQFRSLVFRGYILQ